MPTATQDPTTNTGTGDPNAVITDPTGGAPNFNIQQVFNQFGYYPTQAEITAMAPSFEGTFNVGQIGTSAVAQYVNFKQAEATRAANDPLAALQTKMTDSANQMKQQVTGLYTQLQSVLTQAPQLFGSLSPDQISTYLQPLQNAFQTQLATVQGALGGRGLAGSSTESNALAQTGQQFEQNVLSTGLSVGQTQQQAQATSIQNQINSLLGLTGTEENIAAGAAGQESSQNLGQSNLIASLPYFLDQSSAQQQALAAQKASQGGFQSEFNTVTGDIGQATGAAQNLIDFSKNFAPSSASLGPLGNVGTSSPNRPGNPFASSASYGPGGTNYSAPNASLYDSSSSTGPLSALFQ